MSGGNELLLCVSLEQHLVPQVVLVDIVDDICASSLIALQLITIRHKLVRV